jgi:hypothetical protein
MTTSSKFFAGVAIGAALVLGAGSASAATFLLKDSGAGTTSNLGTTGELTGGDSAVAASKTGVSFLDVGYFTISPGEFLTSYSVTTQGTSLIGEISGGEAGLYKFDGSVYDLLPATVISLATVPTGVIASRANFSDEFDLGPGEYAIAIGSNGVDAVRSQGNAKYSVELQGASVPEPATWAVMLTGFGVVGASMRRARRRPITV